jgi:NNP family nitrate/nitrite transporter-like MFS transporter
MGMRGRLWWQTICLVIEGIMVLIFANTTSLGLAIFIMVIFSSFVQAAEGSSYGIVPYVNPPVTGSISGIVGAGGNTGAVCFGLGFRQLETKQAFVLMGACIISSGVLSLFINIKGHAGLVTGQDSEEAIAAWKKLGASAPAATTLAVPEPDTDAAKDVEADADGSEAEFDQFMQHVSEKKITVEE